MARSEAPIQSFMLTQSLWKNIGIGQIKNWKFIEEENIREIMPDYETTPTALIKTAVVILHDKDTRQVWTKTRTGI